MWHYGPAGGFYVLWLRGFGKAHEMVKVHVFSGQVWGTDPEKPQMTERYETKRRRITIFKFHHSLKNRNWPIGSPLMPALSTFLINMKAASDLLLVMSQHPRRLLHASK